MGSSKKKNSTKQQGQDKSKGQANGHQHKTSTSLDTERKPRTNASPKRNDRPGKSSKSSRDSASPRRSAPPPESHVPWRLLLVLGVVAGGVAIAWTNESARATIEDVYKRHIQPQVLRASEGLSLGYAAIHQMLHGDPPSPSSGTQEPPQAPQEAESSRAASDSSRPPGGGGTDQRKTQTQESATPSSAGTATTATTTTTTTTTTPPPPPPSPPDVKSEKEAGKTDQAVKPEAAKDAGKKPVDEMIQDEEGQPERKTPGKRKEDSRSSVSKGKDKKMGGRTDRPETDGSVDADGKPEKKVNEKVSSDDSERAQTAQKEKTSGGKSEAQEEPPKERNIEEDKASRKEQPARGGGATGKRDKADAGGTVDENKSQDARQKDAAPSKQAKKDEKQPPKTEDEAKVKQEHDSKKDKPTQDDQPKQQDSRAGKKSTTGDSKEEKTVAVDLPTPDANVKDARAKEDVAQEPVVKEIKVKTTPKAEKNAPSGKDKDTADGKLRNEKTDVKKAPPKPGDKSDEKPVASKPADPKDSKPVTPKPEAKPASQKPAGKPDQKQTDRPGDEPETLKPTEKPVASKPAETPADKPVSSSQKPVDKSKEKAAAQTAAEKVDQRPAVKPGDEAADKPDQKPADKPDQKPADKPDQKPADRPDPKPADKQDQKPAGKQDQKPADKQDQKPADKQDQKSADKQDQKPVDKADKTPADKPPDKNPADRPDQKPAHKQDQKPDQKPDRKPDPKQDQKPTGGEASRTPTEKPDESPAKKSDDESTAQAQKAGEKAKTNLATQKPSDTGKDRSAGQPQGGYAKASMTNDADYKIRGKLDEADDLLEKDKYEDALRKYDNILRKHPTSPRAQLGRASTLDKMSAQKRSNDLLELSIKGYHNLLMDSSDAPPELIIMAGRRLADRQQFRVHGGDESMVQKMFFLQEVLRLIDAVDQVAADLDSEDDFDGWSGKAVQTLKFLTEKFPDDVALKQELGVSHLLAGQLEPARRVFQEILALQPHSGFAQCHLGFILKTLDNNHEEAVKLLQAGIDSQEQGTQDGRFFFHLGDAYNRLGRLEESRKVYQRGAEIGLFLSADQRSLYNVDHLTARPWWTPKQTGYQKHLKLLEDNWQMIRDEALSQLNTKTASFQPEAESLLDKGDWKQLTLYQQGRRNKAVCEKVPKTCGLIEQIPDAKGCKRGQVKFSVMSPGVHVWPHCGPTNCRVRAHLGLVVPEGPRIRVVNETKTWKEGKFIIFDDSFEHEVWHDGDSFRLVLIVDFWHPELTEALKRSLPPI